MLMRLILSPKEHILFVHVTNKMEICLVTENNEVQEIRIVFDSLIDVCSMAHLSALFASVS